MIEKQRAFKQRHYGLIRRVAIFLALAITLAAFWRGYSNYFSFSNPREDIVQLQSYEVDYHMLYPEIQSKKTFAETFSWWVSPWRPDTWVAAYWRPLSMQFWWIEAKVFGLDRSYSWMRVNLALFIAFNLLLFTFCRKMLGSLAALVAVALFSFNSWVFFLLNAIMPREAWGSAGLLLSQGWKDQPDLWVNCLFLGSLLAFAGGRWKLAVVLACLALPFKESGILIFPCLVGFAVYLRRLRELPRAAYIAWGSCFVLMMVCRYLAGPLVFSFHVLGHGASLRKALDIFPMGFIVPSDVATYVLGIGAFLVLKLKKPLLVKTLILVSLFIVCLVERSLELGEPFDISLVNWITVETMPLVNLLIALFAAEALLRGSYGRQAVFLFAVATVTSLSYVRAGIALSHVLVFARSLYCILAVCVLKTLWDLMKRRMPMIISAS